MHLQRFFLIYPCSLQSASRVKLVFGKALFYRNVGTIRFLQVDRGTMPRDRIPLQPAARAVCLFLFVAFTAETVYTSPVGSSVTYDQRSFLIDQKRLLILSGSIHYNRVLPSDWDRVLKLARGLGLNTIQTYVFWSFHEQRKGVVDWSGRGNITAFIQRAQENGLYVVVRVGQFFGVKARQLGSIQRSTYTLYPSVRTNVWSRSCDRMLARPTEHLASLQAHAHAHTVAAINFC